MQVLQKLPFAGVVVAAGILLAVLLWSVWPRDPLVLNQEDITRPFGKPFHHSNPPSFTLHGGR